jgi:hypothetical protein
LNERRDGALARKFIEKSLEFADTVCMILPARFAKQHYGISNDLNVNSWIVGNILPSRFDLGLEKFKVITHKCVTVVFQRHNSGKRDRVEISEDSEKNREKRFYQCNDKVENVKME